MDWPNRHLEQVIDHSGAATQGAGRHLRFRTRSGFCQVPDERRPASPSETRGGPAHSEASAEAISPRARPLPGIIFRCPPHSHYRHTARRLGKSGRRPDSDSSRSGSRVPAPQLRTRNIRSRGRREARPGRPRFVNPFLRAPRLECWMFDDRAGARGGEREGDRGQCTRCRTAARTAEIAATRQEGDPTILVGDDPSQVYVRAKAGACAGSGLAVFDIRLPGNVSEAGLIAEVERLNRYYSYGPRFSFRAQIEPHGHRRDRPRKGRRRLPHPVNVGRLWKAVQSNRPATDLHGSSRPGKPVTRSASIVGSTCSPPIAR